MSKPNPTDLARVFAAINDALEAAPDKLDAIETIREYLHGVSPVNSQPIDRVRWVPVEMVEPNDYNPNAVATKEMGLLYTSIKQDGYTQPVVTIWDEERQKFVIVDGFHRYFTCRNREDIRARNKGMLPIVVLRKTINERMAATVRHNRARGEHSVAGMGKLVFGMLENGWSDAEICNHLGLEAEELLKLKHITGFSALFKDAAYSKAWETKHMIRLRQTHEHATGEKVPA